MRASAVADAEEVCEPFGGFVPVRPAGHRGHASTAAVSESLSTSESNGASASSASSRSPCSTSASTSTPPLSTRYIGGAGKSVSAVRASPSAALRSPRRRASHARFARPSGQPAAVARHPGLRDRAVEQRPHLVVPLGPQQRERGPGEERRRERRPVAGRERTGCEVRADLGGLVRQDRDERRDGEQLGRRCGIDSGPLAQRSTASDDRRGGHRVAHPDHDSRGLELQRKLRVVRIELRRRTIENLDRLREALSPVEGARQHDRRARGRLGVRRRVDGVLQVLGPAVEPGPASAVPSSSSIMLLGRAAEARRSRAAGRRRPTRERRSGRPRAQPRRAARRPSRRRPAR